MLAIFFLALAVRLFHLWQVSHGPLFSVLVGDARAYDLWAQQLAAGDWVGHDVFYQAPLYPYALGTFYAIVGHHLIWVRIVQSVGGSLACVLLGCAGTRLFSARAGTFAGLMLAVYPPAVFFDGLVQKTSIDSLLVCVILWLLSRLVDISDLPRQWAALGVAVGALCLNRENALVFVPVILVWIALTSVPRARRWRMATTFMGAVAVVLLPVAARNYAVGGGAFITTSQLGPNFYIGNGAGADGSYRALRPGRGTAEFERVDATELAQQATGRTLTPREVSRYWTGRALSDIAAQPAAWGRLTLRKVGLLLNRVEAIDTESQDSYAEWSWLLTAGSAIGNLGVLLPLALLGCWLTRERLRTAWVLPALALVYAISVVAFYVFARYRFPLVPFVLWAAAGLAALPQWLRAPGRAAFERAGLATAVATLALVANWPMLSHASMQAVGENNLGAALQADGRTTDAVYRFRRAIALDNTQASSYVNLGVALETLGQRTQATEAFRRAVVLQSDLGEAHYFLGKILIDAGLSAEGTAQLRRAVAAMPSSSEARTALGIAFAAQNQFDEAIVEFRELVRRDPASARANWNLGAALSASGHVQDAIPYLEDAVRQDPSNAEARQDLADAHNLRGVGLATDGALRAAAGEFRDALRLDPGLVDAQQNLATAIKMLSSGPAR